MKIIQITFCENSITQTKNIILYKVIANRSIILFQGLRGKMNQHIEQSRVNHEMLILSNVKELKQKSEKKDLEIQQLKQKSELTEMTIEELKKKE